jgi:hypothetical protein
LAELQKLRNRNGGKFKLKNRRRGQMLEAKKVVSSRKNKKADAIGSLKLTGVLI